MIQFMKPQGGYLDLAPLVNLTGTCAVAAVGGISLGAIACCALKALGFSKIGSSVAFATIGVSALPFGVAVLGGAVLVTTWVLAVKAFSNRS
jgi:hypothetical protein